MGSKILTFIISFGLWLLLSLSADMEHIIAGLLVALVVSYTVGSAFAGSPRKWLSMRRYAFFVLYIGVLAKEIFKANLDVAWRVLHPELPVNPGIVKIRTSIKSETGLAFLANSITLTPGTLSVDVDPREGIIYIHWIDVKTRDVEEASRIIASRFESLILEVFG